MAKDPAVLFYTSDFISGTITMTDEQRGKYILLLCIQHQKGYLTEKDMLNICKTYDIDIWSKFIQEGDKFFNERMREETEKRTKYSESRKLNRLKKVKEEKICDNICNSYDKHMENENENINVIIDNKGKEGMGEKPKRFTPPTLSEVEDYISTKKDINPAELKQLAERFINFYESKNWYVGKNKMTNWKAAATNSLAWERATPKKSRLHDSDFN